MNVSYLCLTANKLLHRPDVRARAEERPVTVVGAAHGALLLDGGLVGVDGLARLARVLKRVAQHPVARLATPERVRRVALVLNERKERCC